MIPDIIYNKIYYYLWRINNSNLCKEYKRRIIYHHHYCIVFDTKMYNWRYNIEFNSSIYNNKHELVKHNLSKNYFYSSNN